MQNNYYNERLLELWEAKEIARDKKLLVLSWDTHYICLNKEQSDSIQRILPCQVVADYSNYLSDTEKLNVIEEILSNLLAYSLKEEDILKADGVLEASKHTVYTYNIQLMLETLKN
jgi:hypothetical protein